MADRPIATAPERLSAALSTSLILRPVPSAQRVISKAAPHAAMPPPIRRMSTSSSTTSGFSKPYCSLMRFPLQELAQIDLVRFARDQNVVPLDFRHVAGRLAPACSDLPSHGP